MSKITIIKRSLLIMASLTLVTLVFLGMGWLYPRTMGLSYQVQGGKQLRAVLRDAGIDQDIACTNDPLTDEVSVQELTQAIGKLERAISYSPELAQAYLFLGRANCTIGKYEDSILGYERYTELRPENPEGNLEMGFVYLLQGQSDKAITKWQLIGFNSQTFVSQVGLLQNAQTYTTALQWLDYAEYYGEIYESGRLYLNYQILPSNTKAVAWLERAVMTDTGWINPFSRAEAWRKWGTWLYHEQRYSEAFDALQKAIIIFPINANSASRSEAYRFLGLTLWAQGNILSADEALRQAVQIAPKSPWAQIQGAALQFEMQNLTLEKTSQIFDTVLLANSENKNLWRYVMLFWQDIGQYDKVTHLCQQAQSLGIILAECSDE